MSRMPGLIAAANAKLRRDLFNRLEKSARKAQRDVEKLDDKVRRQTQRDRYEKNAAKSPTPPPVRSAPRDQKLLQILAYCEGDRKDASPQILVRRLAECLLYEQSQVEVGDLTYPVITDHELTLRADDALSRGDTSRATRIAARVKNRDRLLKAVLKGEGTRPYGWDKTTQTLRSAFFAWSMDQDGSRPFTLALTGEAVARAKQTRHKFASGLQERLRRLIARSKEIAARSCVFLCFSCPELFSAQVGPSPRIDDDLGSRAVIGPGIDTGWLGSLPAVPLSPARSASQRP